MVRAQTLWILSAILATCCHAQIDESSFVVISGEADLARINEKTLSISTSLPFVLEDKHVSKLLTATSLNNFEAMGCKLTAAGLRRLAEFKTLRGLRLKTEFRENAQLEALCACPSLTSLHLEGLEGVSLDFVSTLGAAATLEHLSLSGSKLTCGRFGEHVAKLKVLKRLELRGGGKFPETGWGGLGAHPTLTQLTLRGFTPPMGLLNALAGAPNLAELEINADPFDAGDGVFTDEALAALAALAPLQKLALLHAQITGKNFALLAGCKALMSLRIEACARLKDEAFARISEFAKLNSVELNNCPAITDAGISDLANAPALKTLTLYNMPGVTMRSVGYLEMCTEARVQYDAGVGSRHPRKGMQPIVKCKKLVHIHVEAQMANCDVEADAVELWFSPTVDGLKALLNARKIVWLKLTKATDEHLALLSRCAGLLSVVVTQSPSISDAGISAMAANKTLRELYVECGASLSDAALTAFRKHSSLAAISLVTVKADGTRESASQLTDAGLSALASNASLRCLCLTLSDSVTDAGIASLAKLKNLEYVWLYGGSKLTDQSAKSLAGLKGLLHCVFYRAPGLTAAALGYFSNNKLICELAFYFCEGVPLADLKAFYASHPGIILRGGKPRDASGREG
ncbi:hypothetical protein EDM80_13275 [bacterium]|nr:MAG: hypothetical protein EDM80_13275 [bacterium]RIK62045.1 MAG: hypothetical protein DCC64_11045 [Planctomycetota bacterium]